MINHSPGRPASTSAATILVLVIVCTAAIATRWSQPDLLKPFGTDEADYVRALSPGLAATYVGANERSGLDFLREVIAGYRASGWARPFQRDWAAADAAGLRHYHPPLGLYPVAVLAGGGVRDERTLRMVPLALGVLACLSAAWLGGLMVQESPLLAALIAGLLAASSPYHITASTELSFHAAFTLLATLSLGCDVMAARTRTRRWWYAASAMLALTVLTVPYWLVLIPPYLWAGWSARDRDRRPIRLALTGLAVIMATLAVAWPPFLVSAGFVKPVLMYGGIILRPLSGTATTGTWLLELAATHWLTLACLVCGIVGLLIARRRLPRSFIPAAMYCAGFVLVNARVAHMKPLYAGDLAAPLSALAAAAVVMALGPVARPAVAAVALALSVHTITSARTSRLAPDWRPEMAALARTLSGTRVLVTPRAAGAIVAYYAPDSRVVLDSGQPSDLAALRAEAAAGRIDAVLQWGSTFEPGGIARELIDDTPDVSFVIERTPVRVIRRSNAPGVSRETDPLP